VFGNAIAKNRPGHVGILFLAEGLSFSEVPIRAASQQGKTSVTT
jgi:hypothetical protein